MQVLTLFEFRANDGFDVLSQILWYLENIHEYGEGMVKNKVSPFLENMQRLQQNLVKF